MAVIMVLSLAKLNLWSLLLSNNIVVETCKNIPIDMAFSSSLYTITSGLFTKNQLPSGVMLANKTRNDSMIAKGYFALIKKKDSIIAIGILWTKIPMKILECPATGNPSNNACMDRLQKSNQGKVLFSLCIWICPCSAPLLKNSKHIWSNIPTIIKGPTYVFEDWYTSGSNSNMVTANKKAPLKARGSDSWCAFSSLRNKAIPYPTNTARNKATYIKRQK